MRIFFIRCIISIGDITRDMLEEEAENEPNWLWRIALCFTTCAGQINSVLVHRRIRISEHDRRLESLITCPNCRMSVRTRREYAITQTTHLAAALFCCLPYFFKCFKDQKHFCPLCGAYIATLQCTKLNSVTCLVPKIQPEEESSTDS